MKSETTIQYSEWIDVGDVDEVDCEGDGEKGMRRSPQHNETTIQKWSRGFLRETGNELGV